VELEVLIGVQVESLQYQPSQVTTKAERVALQTAPSGVGLEVTGARAKAQRYQQATYGLSQSQLLSRERVVTGLSPSVKENSLKKQHQHKERN